MPSGKRARQQRREAADAAVAVKAPPRVRSKGAPRTGGPAAGLPKAARQASPRALAIGGGLVAIVVIAVVLAVVLAGGKSGSGVPTGTPQVGSAGANALPGASDVQSLFQGIPQNGLTLGNPKAPVAMTMFVDLQCPVCQYWEVNWLPTVVQNYVRQGKVKILLKPWAFIGPDSVRGQSATIAASLQNKGYNFAKVLYDNQGTENTGWLNDRMIASIASSVPGLHVYTLFNQRNSSRVKSIASQVDSLASKDKVTGTPTILVGKTGQKPKLVGTSGAMPTLKQVQAAIALASTQA
jgi:protein-disulfide isomerase